MQSGIYQHYKGGLYLCLGLAAHSETDERMVVYVSLTGAHLPGPRMRVRPLRLWNDFVEWPGGIKAHRFLYMGDIVVDTPVKEESSGNQEQRQLPY